jgi:ATP-binding cassette subfamily C protein
VGFLSAVFPESWHSPVLFVVVVMLASMVLRFFSLLLAVWQTREFMVIAKDISYRIRAGLLGRLQKISMSEYETMGSGAVASHHGQEG